MDPGPKTPLKHVFKTRKYKDHKREMTSENRRILKRLQDSKSTYDVLKWEKERKSVEKYASIKYND